MTPAVPQEHAELVYFRNNGFEIQKRAQVLGTITHSSKGLCVAGTHGKTTTSTMTAHLFHQSHSRMYRFPRRHLQELRHQSAALSEKPLYRHRSRRVRPLFPLAVPVICLSSHATDPDHLDIYGTEEGIPRKLRTLYNTDPAGRCTDYPQRYLTEPKVQAGVRVYTYSRDEGDFHAENIRIGNGEIFIDFVAPDTRINDIQLGVPVSINIENGVAAMALAHLNGVTDEEIRQGMNSFRGVDRRFDFKIKNDQIVFLSDYAHHPSEIKQSVLSIRELYKDKKITAIFQPHLYTRTRDFYQDFADSLSLLDEVILVDIYPARETPIPGVTSKLIYDNLRPGIEKSMCKKEEILNILKDKNIEVLITLGAGDIDNYVPEIKKELEKMKNEERRTKN